MKKVHAVCFFISMFLFVFGILFALVGTAARSHSNQNYTELQPESFVPDTIETVLYDEELGQFYVCYNDANCVNVYSESGEFLWAVATPYLRNSKFELLDDKLVICDWDAYLYDAANGEFIGVEQAENLPLEHHWEKQPAKELIPGNFCFNSYEVFRVNEDGSLLTIVSRPFWHRIVNPFVGFCIALSGALGLGVVVFLHNKQGFDDVRKKNGKKKVRFTNRKAEIFSRYLKVTSVVQGAFAVLDVIFGFFGGFLCIGILPIALHFMVSSAIIYYQIDRMSLSRVERSVLNYNKTVELATFLAAFFSVIVATMIAT